MIEMMNQIDLMNEIMSLWWTFEIDLMNDAMNHWHRIFKIDQINEMLVRYRWFEINLKIEKMKWTHVKGLNQNTRHHKYLSVVVVLVLDVLEIALLEMDYD